MLDHAKLMRELQGVSSKIFVDLSGEFRLARDIWQTVAGQESFLAAVAQADFNRPLPLWQGSIEQVIAVEQHAHAQRTLVAVDGSQIYPDRHQGSSCFLINIGSVVLSYGFQARKVRLTSEPQVFVGDDESYAAGSLIDLVNCRREELEFVKGLALMNEIKEAAVEGEQCLLLVDGSLIFWHLEPKDPVLRMTFLSRYCASLEALYQARHLCAGYISCPKNKDLVNLLRFALEGGLFHGDPHESLDHILDVHIANFFLEPGSRTVVFKHQSKFCDQYPSNIRPYFFYLHVGSEIARIEIPAWIAANTEYVDLVAALILDNSTKGRGYPVVLAEAHEQAVVKGPDRDFFYHLLQKVGLEKQRTIMLSQKTVKKRGIGV